MTRDEIALKAANEIYNLPNEHFLPGKTAQLIAKIQCVVIDALDHYEKAARAGGEVESTLFRCEKCGSEAHANHSTGDELTCNMNGCYGAAYRVSPAPVAKVPEGFPSGALHNARALMHRIECQYSFECEAGPLRNCVDWNELQRCFDYIEFYLSATPQPPEQAVPEDVRLAIKSIKGCSRKTLNWIHEYRLRDHGGFVFTDLPVSSVCTIIDHALSAAPTPEGGE